MSAYIARADITNGLPTSHGISVDNQDIIIAEASAWADAGLCVRYWHFPSLSATPSTPSVVKQLTRIYAQWIAWTQYLSASSRFMPDTVAQLRSEAEDLIAKLTASPPLYQVPPETIANEELEFGTGSLDDSDHLMLCSPYDVIPGSVRMDDYDYGTDYGVYFSYRHRAWIFRKMNNDIVDTDVITYEYNYTRRREQDLPPSVDTVRLSRA